MYGSILEGSSVRSRFNAWFFESFDGYINRLLHQRKTELFSDLPDRIVEIGAGVGANLEYYPTGTILVAVEPNSHMHDRLRRRAEDADIALEILESGAEDIDLPNESVDVVISTLVLCTVPDLEDVLSEVRRILRPGGRFLFLEHVAAPEGTLLRKLQQWIQTPWHYLFEGCDTTREISSSLESAGFRSVQFAPYKLRSPFLPVNLQIAGTATK